MREALLVLILLLGCTSAPDEAVPEPDIPDVPDDPEPVCNGPVCGSDGITYDTDCDAIDANIDSFTVGECVSEPEPPECIETDGGIHSDVSGSVTLGNVTFDDSCTNSTVLLEYTCVNNEIKNSTVTCEGMCIDGECVDLEPIIDDRCIGPIEPSIAEQNVVKILGSNYTDSCVDFNTVKSYYCKDNNVTAANLNCESGYRCDQGVCVELENGCTETDEGKDIFTKGQTTGFLGLATTLKEWDECEDEGSIKEYYCDLDEAKSEILYCGSGFKCANGKCVKSNCEETDGGRDIFKAGKVTIDDKDYKDFCPGDYKLREYFCYGDGYESDDVQCPKDHICDGGRCVEGYYD